MSIDWINFTPWSAAIGGAVIGLAAALLVLVNGRVAGIMPLPGNVGATSLCFGGHDFETLYVAGGGKVYRRKLHSVGAPPWTAPFKLPPWGAG